MKKNVVLLGLLLFGISCTKEKPFEEVPNKKTIDKSVFVDRSVVSQGGVQTVSEKPIERIAVMSYGLSSRRAIDAMPYFMGRTKLVSFEITEKAMEVREIELDDRFTGNPTNSKSVMSLPVRHVDYDCQRDSYGECQNKEIEDTKKDWKLRNLLEIDFIGSRIMDIDQLPVQLSNLYDGCYTETSTRLVDYEVSTDVFNYEVEKSYVFSNLSWSCIGALISGGDFSLSDLSFDVRYVYSMVRADKISSQQYRPVHYEVQDEGTFGFFDTRINKLDVDGTQSEGKDLVLLNRWNPNRQTIKYILSHEFYKPENDYVLEATLEGIKHVNQGLLDANTGLQIEIEQGSAQTKVGDLRNTMVVLVEDPLAARIIGYGPSVAHPRTGEIVNARTVMYLGTIRGIVKRVYEEILDEERSVVQSDISKSKLSLKQKDEIRKRLAHLSSQKDKAKVSKQFAQLQKDLDLVGQSRKIAHSKSQVKEKSRVSNGTVQAILKSLKTYKKLESESLISKEGRYIDKRVDVLSRHSATPEEVVNARFAFESSGVRGKLPENLKPWEDLSDTEKELITREVLPHVWIPTLVHEMGHNLGLRHNFSGSEDKANFYTKEELEGMGITREIPYSSVMEYSYRTMNELPTLGKYDIAALKFAYAREVEAVDAQGGKHIYKVAGTIKDVVAEATSNQHSLVEYRYCTDEHVDANPTCNRFDEGTNLVEIVSHFIRAYDENYKRLNTRDGRENFTMLQEPGYLGRISSNFYDIRLVFEIMDRISVQYGIPLDNPIWSEQLTEIYQAAVLGGNFLVDVIVQPDVQCALGTVFNPQEMIAVLPLKSIGRFWNPQITNCFSSESQRAIDELAQANGIPPGILVAGAQAGKSFQSKKDPENENPYADQIDVQGIWIDKMLALEYLLVRELGSTLFDQGTQNFLDLPDVGNRAINIMGGHLLGVGATDVAFKDAQGNNIEMIDDQGQILKTASVAIEMNEEHTISVPLFEGLARYFGMPLKQTSFAKESVRTLKRLIPSEVNQSVSDSILTVFDVKTKASELDRPVSEYNTVDVSRVRYYALPDNQVADFSITALKISRVLAQLTEEKLIEIFGLIQEGKELPAEATDLEKAAYSLGAEAIAMFVNGDIKLPNYYEKLLADLNAEVL